MTYRIINEYANNIINEIRKTQLALDPVAIEKSIKENLINAFNLGVTMAADDCYDQMRYDLTPEERKNSILDLKL